MPLPQNAFLAASLRVGIVLSGTLFMVMLNIPEEPQLLAGPYEGPVGHVTEYEGRTMSSVWMVMVVCVVKLTEDVAEDDNERADSEVK